MHKHSGKVDLLMSKFGAFDDALCVYKLIDAGIVIYVGQTNQLRKRLQNHIQYKSFDSISFELCNKQDANEIEAANIIKHMPLHNKSLPKNSGFILVGSAKRRLSDHVVDVLNSFDQVKVSNYAGGYKYIPSSVYDQLNEHISNFKYKIINKEIK